ncbi:hypothetical protein NN561_012044 [Cricetulus griseus]
MASPVSCRKRTRRCLKSQMVRMVRVSSRMKVSRLTLSCRWLSSASFSVASSSMALLSSAAAPEEEAAAPARSPRPSSTGNSGSSSSRGDSAQTALPGRRCAASLSSMTPGPPAPLPRGDQQQPARSSAASRGTDLPGGYGRSSSSSRQRLAWAAPSCGGGARAVRRIPKRRPPPAHLFIRRRAPPPLAYSTATRVERALSFASRQAVSPSVAPHWSSCPELPGQTVWGQLASFWVVAARLPKWDRRGHSLLARNISSD